MNDIEMHKISEEFFRCWQASGKHLQALAQDGSLSWLKANLNPPFLEHLSFRMGNQLYFIRIEDVDGKVLGPGNPNGFRTIAKGCNGFPCRMPMRRIGFEWKPDAPEWGLIHAETGQLINPIALKSDEKMEMTDWELHDFSVQVVRDYIAEKLGRQMMSSQGNPNVDPAIWFVGDNGPEWVVVRAVKFPEKEAMVPSNLPAIAASCARMSTVGHFASVAVASAEDPFNPSVDVPPLPLWRGHEMFIRFEGLVPAKVQ